MLAQGTLLFQDGVGGVLIHIYSPQLADPLFEITGNGPNDLPSGTTIYTGAPMGGSGSGAGFDNGNNITVQIYAAPGNVVSGGIAGLSPMSQYISTMGTRPKGAGLFIGQIFGVSNPDPGVPGATGNIGATVSLAAWYNYGTYVSPANPGRGLWSSVPRGWSPLVFIPGSNLGIGTGTPANIVGLQSFSLVGEYPEVTPEPSVIVLGALGAALTLHRYCKRTSNRRPAGAPAAVSSSGGN